MLTTLSSLYLYRPLRTSLFFSTQTILTTTPTSLHIPCCTSPTSTHLQEQNEEQRIDVPKVELLKQKLELIGIIYSSSCVPGHYCNVMCPKCNGGKSLERSLSLYIVQKGDLPRLRCFRMDCNWADKVFLDGKAGVDEEKKRKVILPFGEKTAESLRLVPIREQSIEGELWCNGKLLHW